jgi:hypothetical protein
MYNMNESQKHAEQEKLHIKEYILYDSIHM